MSHKVFKPVSMASMNIDSLVKPVVIASDVDNGVFVKIGDAGSTIFGEVEEGCVSAVLASAKTDVVGVIDSSANPLADGYDVGLQDPRDVYSKANIPTRARLLFPFDEFLVETAAINGTLGANKHVVIDTTLGQSGKLIYANTFEDCAFVAQIIATGVPIVVGGTYIGAGTLLRVIRNAGVYADNIAGIDPDDLTALQTAVGDVEDLNTTASVLVGAINELVAALAGKATIATNEDTATIGQILQANGDGSFTFVDAT
ncbi:MAG: hypothetical protein PHX50_13860 [Massilibacteroides sp.]|nr:hypothetical protein [Massilibacteroides sp.]